MSKEVKVALIGAAATILAAIITGIFLLRSQPNNSATSTTSASAGSITQAITQSANTNASTPEATLITFCNAMKEGNYVTAYDQFSSQTKSLVSEQSFISGNLSISQRLLQ